MRDFEKVKETREFSLDGRHLSGIIMGSLVLALVTFGVGYILGQQASRPVTIQQNDVWESLLTKDPPVKKNLYTFEKELQETNSILPQKKTAGLQNPTLNLNTPPVPRLEQPTGPKQPDPKLVPKGYSLQIRAFKNIVEANEFISTLRREGYTPHMILSDIPGRGRWYRVRVGRFSTMQAALSFQKNFETKEGIATFVSAL